jgi:nicotinate-nucleotide adenylyltransferase
MSGLLDEPGIRTSPIEREIEEKEHHGASYTLYTVRSLKEKFPSHTFFWCVGSDIVLDQSYLEWHKWAQLRQEITFLVLERSGYELGSLQLPECFAMVPGCGYNTARDISSTEVRTMIRAGEDITPYVGKKVAEYIQEHKLYQDQGR